METDVMKLKNAKKMSQHNQQWHFFNESLRAAIALMSTHAAALEPSDRDILSRKAGCLRLELFARTGGGNLTQLGKLEEDDMGM